MLVSSSAVASPLALNSPSRKSRRGEQLNNAGSTLRATRVLFGTGSTSS
jgi:hypothetical protein